MLALKLFSHPLVLLNPPLPTTDQALIWSELHGSAAALAIAEAACRNTSTMVIVLADPHQLQSIRSEIGFYLGDQQKEAIFTFPDWECLPYDVFSPNHDIISQRLQTLSQLPTLERAVVLTTCASLMQRLPPVEYVLRNSFCLQQQQKINVEGLRNQLTNTNYMAVQQVIAPGEFSFRGGLIDIFPMGSDSPFRIDLFDDEIESIHYFDPDTQGSTEQVTDISLLPAREFPMAKEDIQRFQKAFCQHFKGNPHTQKIYTEISNNHTPAGTEFFFPLFFENTCTLFDYVQDDTLWLISDTFEKTTKTQWAEIIERYENTSNDTEQKALPPELLYLTPRELQLQINDYRSITQHIGTYSNNASNNVTWVAPTNPNKQLPVDPRAETPYQILIDHIKASDDRILITVETIGRREGIEGVLNTHNITAALFENFDEFTRSKAKLGICVYPLMAGLLLPQHTIEVISESQLYGEQAFQRRHTRKKLDPEAIIRSLAELHEGAPVVHINHGVGRYHGLSVLNVDEEPTEFLVIEYRGGDKLYVPILSLHLISRFSGGATEHTPWHRLGGEQWKKTKSRARVKAYDVATELLEMEALRNTRTSYAFKVPEDEYQAFVNRFPFTETIDQKRVMEEVRADLESTEPMDRLVCGDVGFGKTEIALRAAFIAVHNNYQVAILVPTTLLAQQHYETFIDRFADLSISVNMLSRFKTKKQATELIENLRKGVLDIVIGTHRLLQKDIKFKRIGLLIIDEEHHFGVRQKEKIKKLRSEVDILNLTATPIPRTLNIAMSGLRSISLITTAPDSRLSIKTYIRNFDHGLIRDACLREIRRGGQIYFLYNSVRTIDRFAEEIAELVPEAKVRVAHGQMRELQLERVMQDFHHQTFNLLVCTTVIESGIDIPSANTIIIYRADRFGLAQLHQLRGRVGRSHRQAFAYLLITADRNLLTNDAQKRLDAFELMSELGAGFTLATHDLEIRGAGDFLGEAQSGTINDVGFSLYSEYLNMAIASIKKKQGLDHKQATDSITEQTKTIIDLHLPALFPTDYIPNPHTRLTLYKRIASISKQEEWDELQVEIIDQFGLLPETGKTLFHLTELRLQAECLGICKIDISDRGGTIDFIDEPPIDVSVIFDLVRKAPLVYRLSGSSTLMLTGDFSNPKARIEQLENLMDTLNTKLSV